MPFSPTESTNTKRLLDGYTRNRLRVALDQGEVLALLKQRVGNRKWKAYRAENCPRVAERTDVLHRRLAAHRLRIEQELTSNPDLGVVEATKLIATPKPFTHKTQPAAPKDRNATLEIELAAARMRIRELESRVAHPLTPDNEKIAVEARAVLELLRHLTSTNIETIREKAAQIVRLADPRAQFKRKPEPPPTHEALDTAAWPRAMSLAVRDPGDMPEFMQREPATRAIN